MKTFTQKRKELEKEIVAKIEKLILKKGVKSTHKNCLVLKVKDNEQFNLDGGRYLTEIGIDGLVDCNGYSYDHSILSLEQLCEVVDNL
jgi:hypothetical protein